MTIATFSDHTATFPQTAATNAAGTAIIEARHVGKTYRAERGKELTVLRDISFTLHEGEIVAILGRSGAGKSTFLRLINQLETLTGGEIDVDGEMIGYKYVDKDGKQVLQTLNDKEVAEQRSKLGMVFQRFNLFPHMTALENVMEAPVHVKHMDKRKPASLPSKS